MQTQASPEALESLEREIRQQEEDLRVQTPLHKRKQEEVLSMKQDIQKKQIQIDAAKSDLQRAEIEEGAFQVKLLQLAQRIEQSKRRAEMMKQELLRAKNLKKSSDD